MIALLRIAVVVVVLVLLARAARVAWRNRRLAFVVWRRIGARHVAGSLGLVVVVLATALALLQFVPVTSLGLGRLIGLSGNAVFAPLEEATLRSAGGAPPAAPIDPAEPAALPRPSLPVAAGTVVFLGGLLLLFPWLAYVEERVFREGLEDATLGLQVWRALKFGLLHMVMLIPLAAALAIGVAGFVYGRIYRRAYHRAAEQSEVVQGPFGIPVVMPLPVQRLRAQAVLETTVWHAAFNSTIVALVLVGFVVDWTLRAA